MIKNLSIHADIILASYVPLVKLLGEVCGKHCEVVLHNPAHPESSVIAIANGHLSGRLPGAPLTDLILKWIQDRVYEKQDYVENYRSYLKNGQEACSSTFFIRDAAGDLAGLLCFNRDIRVFNRFYSDMSTIMKEYFGMSFPEDRHPAENHRLEDAENFSESVEELMKTSMEKELSQLDIPVDRFSPKERIRVMSSLHDRGFFQLRGAVESVADALQISEATAYRYLKKIQKSSPL